MLCRARDIISIPSPNPAPDQITSFAGSHSRLFEHHQRSSSSSFVEISVKIIAHVYNDDSHRSGIVGGAKFQSFQLAQWQANQMEASH